MKRLFLPALICLLSVVSCRFIEELKHMEAPEIISWSPGEENQEAPELHEVSLDFSTSMNQSLTEAAFSLTENEVDIQGDFIWEENRMRFLPYQGFAADKSYTMSLKKTAEDGFGNSFSQEWSTEFATGSDHEAPLFRKAEPVDFSKITNLRQEFTLLFSESLDQQSFRDAFSIVPNLKYFLEWVDNKVIVHPLEDFENGKEYTLSISKSLMDQAGNRMDREIDLIYTVTARDDPLLESIILTSSGGELDPSGINTGVEKDDVITGHVNRIMNEEERLNLVRLTPESPYDVNWNSNFQDFTLSFESLDWEGHYELNLLEQNYLLLADGVESRPPEVISLAFCSDSSGVLPQILSLNSSLGASDSTTAFLDFLFVRSDAGTISQFSLMNALSFDSAVLSFETIGYEVYDGSQTPGPAVSPGPGESLIRIHLNISDTGLPGIVTFSLSETLSDTLGNSLKEPWYLTVNQP
ncbi:Ig-like domain-containing protein [Oceanispirochaeta sp.]|jgi:hypothetical protein|uniref:Ig-like domain-containing protein n=1 Tax=Oceanispirochaeta sp. TaxID=2035350 RepID=UPI002605ED4B|nr:Ig-like domain-containing protein [Oceanispirochaeta sp.]MDA3957999.1 Ig-like domain-containing protein [Oceanispirochaeta sp.]